MDRARQAEREYLCVDRFMRDAVGARALASAFELGLVDRMLERESCTVFELGEAAKVDRRGTLLLAGLLRAGGVIEAVGGGFGLTKAFRDALRFRDLLQAKLDFAAAVAPDFFELFTVLLENPAAFFERAKLFRIFSYDRCFDPTPENVSNTARWMRFTTVLTRYESAACIANHDFSKYRRMLDVGGNSGEFALRICRAHAAMRATIFDLPVVCDIGERHLRAEPEAARIEFARAGRDGGGMPGAFDLVTFKSMLHDWPDDRVQAFLVRAYEALLPGGTLLIFERGLVEVGEQQIQYAMIPLLLFFRSYRGVGEYREALAGAGFVDIQAGSIELDLPFMLLTAKKPAKT